jgi:hypothetical protein
MALTPTKRARGANARVITAFETTVGAPPAINTGWTLTPIVSHSLGEERPLIESNLLGQGREMHARRGDQRWRHRRAGRRP